MLDPMLICYVTVPITRNVPDHTRFSAVHLLALNLLHFIQHFNVLEPEFYI